MGMLRKLVEGFADGVLSASRMNGSNGASGKGRVPQLCRQNGWDVDEVTEDGTIKLHFKDQQAEGGIRKVCIREGELLAHFYSVSHAVLPENRVPEEVLGYLLTHNYEQKIGGWSACEDDGEVGFLMEYNALAAGLSAEAFKFVCEQLVTAVSEFDGKMRKARML